MSRAQDVMTNLLALAEIRIRSQLATVTFNDLNKLDIPVILFLSRHDYTTPAPISAAWMERLKAPKKVIVWFENSAHLHILEDPATFSPPFWNMSGRWQRKPR